jgi:hypothetical protein
MDYARTRRIRRQAKVGKHQRGNNPQHDGIQNGAMPEEEEDHAHSV